MTKIELMAGAQAEFFSSKAAYPGYFGGRGAGKTVAGLVKMVGYITDNPGAVGCVTTPGLDDHERILMPAMDKLFGEGRGKWWDYLKREHLMVFGDVKSGQLSGRVFLRTVDEPERLRGMTLAFGWMDEVGQGDQWAAFGNLQLSLRQEGYPGQLWVTSTPNLDRQWVRLLWQEKVWPDSRQPVDTLEDWPVFHAKTKDNWHLPERMRVDLIKQFGDTPRARQELEGEFLRAAGIALADWVDENEHIRWPKADEVWRQTGIAGIDFGGVSPTALVEWRQDESGRLWAVDEFYKRNASEEEWVEWCRDRNIKKLICDPTGTSEQAVRERRRRYGIPIERAAARMIYWTDRLSIWRNGLTSGMIRISPLCQNLRSELMTLEARIRRGTDEPADDWPQGAADHAYDAGAYGMSFFDRTVGRPNPALRLVHA